MQRILLGWTSIGLLAFAAGCTLCAAPYDYCGPTFGGNGCGNGSCDTRLRSGSILAPADGGMVAGAVTEGPVMMQQQGPGEVIMPGDEIIEQGAPALQGAPGPTPAKAPQTTMRKRVQR